MKVSSKSSAGVVALIQYDDGKSIEFAEGVEDLETQTPITKSSIFDIASVSKQFTAFCILLLEDKGMLKVSDLLSKFVPQATIFGHDITIQDLIYHTSGLPCLFDIAEDKNIGYFEEFSTGVITAGIFENGLQFTPNTKHEYSNSGYIMLANVVESVSGKKFSTFVQEEIFNPLGMTNSFVSNGLSVEKRAVSGYQKEGPNGFVKVFSPWAVRGAGLVHSSASDLMKWGLNFSSGNVGGKTLIEKMLVPLPEHNKDGIRIVDHSAYCFGLGLDKNGSSNIYCHLGSTFGRESCFIRSQDAGYTAVVLSNIEGYDVLSLAPKLLEAAEKVTS